MDERKLIWKQEISEKKKKLKIHFKEIIYSLLILNLLKYMSVNNAFFIYTFILK